MDDRLTEEELRLMVNDDKLFDNYDLANMYSVCDDFGEARSCTDCNLPHIEKNEHLFYTYKYTRCIECSKKYTKMYAKNNKEKVRLYAKNYRERRKEIDEYYKCYDQ